MADETSEVELLRRFGRPSQSDAAIGAQRDQDIIATYGAAGDPVFNFLDGDFGPKQPSFLNQLFTGSVHTTPEEAEQQIALIRARALEGLTGQSPSILTKAREADPESDMFSIQSVPEMRQALQSLGFNSGPVGQQQIDFIRNAFERGRIDGIKPGLMKEIEARFGPDDEDLINELGGMLSNAQSVQDVTNVQRIMEANLARKDDEAAAGDDKRANTSEARLAERLRFDRNKATPKWVPLDEYDSNGNQVEQYMRIGPKGENFGPIPGAAKRVVESDVAGTIETITYGIDGDVIRESRSSPIGTAGLPLGNITGQKKISGAEKAFDISRGRGLGARRDKAERARSDGITSAKVAIPIIQNLTDAISKGTIGTGLFGSVAGSVSTLQNQILQMDRAANAEAVRRGSAHSSPVTEPDFINLIRELGSELGSTSLWDQVERNSNLRSQYFTLAHFLARATNRSNRPTTSENMKVALRQLDSTGTDPRKMRAAMRGAFESLFTGLDSEARENNLPGIISTLSTEELLTIAPDLADTTKWKTIGIKRPILDDRGKAIPNRFEIQTYWERKTALDRLGE